MNNFLVMVGKGMVLGAILLAFFAAGLWVFGAWHDEWSGFNAQFTVSDGVCNVAVIPVHAEISSYTYYDETGAEILTSTLDDFELALRNAENDPYIEAVLVSVDSPGGSPYAGEAMANALLRSPLPSAAVGRDLMLSAGYWLSTGADHVVASALSSVGSIGVTRSYVEVADENADLGRNFIEIASAPFKDAGNPEKVLTEEEYEIFKREADLLHQEFVRQVAANRGLPVEAVSALADGSSLLGAEALEAGLIDQLGDKETARIWLAGQLGLDTEDVILCE